MIGVTGIQIDPEKLFAAFHELDKSYARAVAAVEWFGHALDRQRRARRSKFISQKLFDTLRCAVSFAPEANHSSAGRPNDKRSKRPG